jgi:hypothetical protein
VDERKKSIRELEAKKQETLENLDKLRRSWGEAVLFRLDAENPDRFAGELGRRRQFLEAIALLRGRIRTLEEDALRLRALENALAEQDKAVADKARALEELRVPLGEAALRAGFEFEPPLRDQAEDLEAVIEARRRRLGELEAGKGAGFLSRIGAAARGALIRSRLAKDLDGLNRLYGSAGEQFFAALEQRGEDPGDMEDIPARMRALGQELALLEESRGSLREEWGTLRDGLGIEGNSRNFNPAKKIRELEQRIDREQEQLGELYAAFGRRLYDLWGEDPRRLSPDAEAGEEAPLQGEDKNTLARIREMLDQAAGYEAAIEKLKASLRIDEKRAAIDTMKKSILGHRRRIAADENAIAGLEKQIEEANRHIEELLKL